MIEWIIGIGGLVLGSGVTSTIQFFTNRHDNKRQETREALGGIINELSTFGQALHIAYDAWQDNIRKLTDLLDSHLKATSRYNKFLKNYTPNVEALIEKHKHCFCELAPTCPNRIEGELPMELADFLQRGTDAEDEYTKESKDFEKGCLEILEEVVKSICGYKDFLNHIPDAYKIPQPIFKKIYPLLSEIDSANSIIINCIHFIKSDPICIGDSKSHLGRSILHTIKSVELAKLTIAKELNEL